MKEFWAAEEARTILLPKGDDKGPCIAAFQVQTGIEVPEFSGERLKVRSNGRTFYLLKGDDVVESIAGGYGDVGLAGSDATLEYSLVNPGKIRTARIGAAMCRFSLLADIAEARKMDALLIPSGRMVSAYRVATRRPNMLSALAQQQDIPVVPDSVRVRGSEEVLFGLRGLSLTAAIVVSGETARQNEVAEVRPLCDIFPEMVLKGE